MRKLLFFSAIQLLLLPMFAQQLQTSSLYDLQSVFHNPATAGISQKGFVGITYRNQWAGISGNPKTGTVFGSYAMPQHNIGIGGYVYIDQTGPTSRTGLQLAFAKHIPLNDGAKVSLGIEARGLQYSIDMGKLSQTLGNDPVLGSNDNKFKFDAGFGAAYSDKKLKIGAAVSQLIQSKLGFYTGNLSSGEEGRLYRHYYFHGSYQLIWDGHTTVTPHFLAIVLPNAPSEIQIGARVVHNEIFWWGIGLRVNQNLMFSAGVHPNKDLSIGYAFDLFKTPLSVFENGSNAHEVSLRYNLFN